MNLESFAVPTVIVAVSLFVLKEIFEFFRRRNADMRKCIAMRTMLARECELNHWTIKRLRDSIGQIADDFKNERKASYSIKRHINGDEYFARIGPDGESGSHIPLAHSEIMRKLMLDVATLDQALLPKLQNAYDAVAELQHVRESLIRHTGADEDSDDAHWLDGFIMYATDELKDIFDALGALYVACTGKPLSTHRLR